MNIGAPWPDQETARTRVLEMQTKLHRWATGDADRRFDDLFNLIYDPAFLASAWYRVRGNKGGRTAGVDGVAPSSIDSPAVFLTELRDALKARCYTPARVREKAIPKTDGKVRRLGIPTTADRVVQASLTMVLEPIFEADFCRAPTVSGPIVVPKTLSARFASLLLQHEITNGYSRRTLRLALITLNMRRYCAAWENVSETRE